MTPAQRRRVHRLALPMAAVGLAATVMTALPLAVMSSLGAPAPRVLVLLHIGGAATLVAGVVVKVGALRLARRGQARTWPAFVARLGLALGTYATLTGMLVALDPAWANQHLASSFWATLVIATHARHRWRVARRMLAPAPGWPARQSAPARARA